MPAASPVRPQRSGALYRIPAAFMSVMPPSERTPRHARRRAADAEDATVVELKTTERTATPPHDATPGDAAAEMFRLSVESCPTGMMMSDETGTIMMVNSEIERLFGYRREELIGRPIDMLVPERLRRQHGRHRQRFAHDPERRPVGHNRDLMALRQDGSEFPAEIGLNPIRTRDGLMVLSTITDVSERKRLERLKDEFVAMVSHELRTPLTSIAGSLGLLMGNAAGSLPNAATRLLSIAHANSQRLVRLINDILDLQKIEAGQVVFHLKYLDLRPFIEQTLEANRAFAHDFGVRIRLDEGSCDGDVFADGDRLAQIITNLLSNAIKFSPTGSEVMVGIERRGDNIRVWVRDRGPGIPEEFMPRIFEKFAQADSSDARQKGGTGLGLSIVKQLIHQHGGTVGFEPAPGGGTIFYFELPGSTQAVANQAAPGSTILLCENDAATSGCLANALRHAGFAVEAASTAACAQAHAAETPYAAVLIDPKLPDLDGVSLVHQLRALPRHAATPMVFFALNPEPSVRMQFGALPLNDWLVKPADRGEYVRAIHRAIVELGTSLDASLGASLGTLRPRVLHVEPDGDLRHLVREALGAHADIASMDSIDGARRARAGLAFDLAVLDLAQVDDAGLEVLKSLCDQGGHPVTALVFSADPASMLAQRVGSALAGAHLSIDGIVGTVRLAVARRGAGAPARIEVA